MKLLIIEDDVNLIYFLKQFLEARNFCVDFAQDGEQGSYLARINKYDLIILDYELPKKDGLQVCREIRIKNKQVPILGLSVKTDVDSKVKLLEEGADDYLAKPYSHKELLARIHCLLRRKNVIESTIKKIDTLTVDDSNCSVARDGKNIYLTRKEFLILSFLLDNKDHIISRTEILEAVWDNNVNYFSNTVDTHIFSIRKKIENVSRPKLIHTVPGRGFLLSLKKP